METSIIFRQTESESTFLDPRKGFQPTTVGFQVRFDPLTGRSGHFSHFGAINWQPLDLDQYRKDMESSFCPFCRENRDKATPKFPEALTGTGRPSSGEAMLIPNLFPYDVYSSVAIMTEDHVVPLDGFNSTRLLDTFCLGVSFLKRVADAAPDLPFHAMGWNYMPPSGGGLVHPHQQYFATNEPGNAFRDEYAASEAFLKKWGTDYWSALIEEESGRGERYVGKTGDCHWLASYVSLGIPGDITVVFPRVFSVLDIDDEQIAGLVTGLQRVFAYFIDTGIFSFNASWFFGARGQKFFPSHMRIIPRTFLNTRDHASDFNFFQSLFNEPVSIVMPEDLCKGLRRYFEQPE